VTAGRVTAGDHTVLVDVIELGEAVECRRDIVEGSGPPTARLPDTPVLDVPGGDPAPGEVVREWRHQRAIPPRPPETPVEERDARPGTPFRRGEHVEVRDLVGVLAVRQAWRGRDFVVIHRKRCQARSARCAARASRRRSTSSSTL